MCIDQTNTEEKSHQVAFMSEIYHIAGTVHVWLGEPTLALSPLFPGRYMVGLWNSKLYSFLRHRLERRQQWLGDEDLTIRASFGRMWTLQETVMAQRARIWCDGENEDWDTIYVIVFRKSWRDH
jgi:hypothetical protein